MAIKYILRVLAVPFLLAIALVSPVYATGADAVERTFTLAKELADKVATGPADGLQQDLPQTSPDSDPSGPTQTKYPGIENMRIERGGNGIPTISIYYPALGNPTIDAKLKSFAESLADSFEKVQIEDYKDEEKPDSYGAWEESVFFTIERPNPDVVSITFNIATYTGGAHGQLIVDVQNYDLKNSTQLTFQDLFANQQKALEILSKVSETKLRASLGDDVEEEMLVSGTSPEIDNFDNLSLLPSGVAVEFQPYQVGPWAIGQQRVEISLNELAQAGPSPSIWPPKRDSLGESQ